MTSPKRYGGNCDVQQIEIFDNLIFEKKGRLVTAKEVAELLAVSVRTIRDWVYLRKIPFIKINGAVRFDLKVLKKWVAEELWQS